MLVEGDSEDSGEEITTDEGGRSTSEEQEEMGLEGPMSLGEVDEEEDVEMVDVTDRTLHVPFRGPESLVEARMLTLSTRNTSIEAGLPPERRGDKSTAQRVGRRWEMEAGEESSQTRA